MPKNTIREKFWKKFSGGECKEHNLEAIADWIQAEFDSLLAEKVAEAFKKGQEDGVQKMLDMLRQDPLKCPKCGKNFIKDEKNSSEYNTTYYCECTPELFLSVG